MTSFSDHARLRLDTLIEINQLLLSSIEPDELIRIILNSAIQLFTSEACSIAVLDEDSRQLVIDFSAGDTLVQGVRIDMGQGIAGWVARTGEGVLCNDASADPRFWSGIDHKTGFETKAILCVPLKQQGRIIGVIEVINTLNPAGFEQDDLRLLNAFGGLVATAISRARAVSTIHNANIAFQEVLQERYRFVVGKSPAMQSALRLAQTVAPAATTVLLLGESGTGKEVMARFIHQASPRSAHPFVAVNCVALTQELTESELFGHEKGAFTGAITQKKGRFELADGGTIFLDEIGEISLSLQAKLLRVLQEREFQRVGGTRDISVNVRIIAATNRDLRHAVQTGAFREDLFYRLNVVSITMPPLRGRGDDITALVYHFVDRYCLELKRPRLEVDPSVMELFKSYTWPGNVRELQNAIERAVVLCHGTKITKEELTPDIYLQPPAMQDAPICHPELGSGSHGEEVPKQVRNDMRDDSGVNRKAELSYEQLPMAEAMEHFKRDLIRQTLERVRGNQSEAARILGLERSNLSRILKRLGLR